MRGVDVSHAGGLCSIPRLTRYFFDLNTKEPFVKLNFSTETKSLKRWSEMCRFTPGPILSKEIKKTQKDACMYTLI